MRRVTGVCLESTVNIRTDLTTLCPSTTRVTMTGSWAMEVFALWVTTAQVGWAVSTPSSVQTEPTVTRRAYPSVSPVLKVRTSQQIVHFQFMKIHYTSFLWSGIA